MIKDYFHIIKTLLQPNQICESVEDIPLEALRYKGYHVMFVDIDNTLVPYDKRSLSLQKMQWIEQVKSLGFTVYIVSNNSSHRRIQKIAEQMGVSGLYFSMKPFTMGIREFIKEHYIDLEKSLFVGDKLLTDIIAGNWLRTHTILVDPLDKKLSFFKTMQRDMELFLLSKL